MPRRLGLPSVYLAAAVATAATTAVPLAMTPVSGLALRPVAAEPDRPVDATGAIRQNPARAFNLLMRNGGL
ncbi:hypothetical protein OHA25_28035 [Nonomuraea sp. NBC_00507]|uniref:hypothetical protein n=1 Tax=Nonomuraea sp. NBC_00507 TaxID=2976002 RepID=UPI002E16F6D7